MLRGELRGTRCYVDLRRALDRVWIAYLHLHCVSLHLITPFLRCNGLAPALVAVEVEAHGSRGARRNWRRNDAMCSVTRLVCEAMLRFQHTARATFRDPKPITG